MSVMLDFISLVVSSSIAVLIFVLQSRLSDKEMVDRRLEIEKEAGEKLSYIRKQRANSRVQIYNSKLIGSKGFTANRRSFLWGHSYHAAELYDLAFDGVEFVCGLEEWNGRKYYKVGVVPYLRILKLQKNGDRSFSGPIFYVKPKLLQLDRYSIAYSGFRYYAVNEAYRSTKAKPLLFRIRDSLISAGRRSRYFVYYKWKNNFRQK